MESGEHQLDWLPLAKVEQACFHQGHAWDPRRTKVRRGYWRGL